jgi:pimeloyl-ACP methyl ester carboxylesterase
MGRSPLSGWPLLWRLRGAGLRTATFGYVAALERFDSIADRLRARIEKLSKVGPYVVVGHSLGGVLLRAAINKLSPLNELPKHVYLLGSPIEPSRLATKLKRNLIFRALAGDSGQLLGSAERMRAVKALSVPTTAIIGVRGVIATKAQFGRDANDGVVAKSEVSAEWFAGRHEVPVMHTLLPSNADVAQIIIQALLANTASAAER